MRLIRGLMVVGLSLALAMPSLAAPAARKANNSTKATVKKTKHHQHLVRGTVVSVQHGQNGHGTIKVKVAHHHHSHKAVSARASTRRHLHHDIVTFHVNQHTKFVFTTHRKGKDHHQPASFSAVHKGEQVRTHVGHHHLARKVEILNGQQPKTTVAKKTPTKKTPTKKK